MMTSCWRHCVSRARHGFRLTTTRSSLVLFLIAQTLLSFGLLSSQAYANPLPLSWNRILSKHGFSSSMLGLSILDENGKAVVSINADDAFKPASNQKILITAAALSELGENYEYVTRLWAESYPDRDGVLKDDLIVTGTGDPNISGRFTSDDPTLIFRTWARSLKKNGLKRIKGDLLIDDFHFDCSTSSPWLEKEV